jgi:hypothetical protein
MAARRAGACVGGRGAIEPEAARTPLPYMAEKPVLPAEKDAGVWNALLEIHARIPPARRRQLYFVIALMILGAMLELATIGAVLPFLALLADPQRMSQIPEALSLLKTVGAVTIHQQLIAATGLFVGLVLLAGVVRLQLSWSCRKFIFQTGHDTEPASCDWLRSGPIVDEPSIAQRQYAYRRGSPACENYARKRTAGGWKSAARKRAIRSS